MTTLTLQLPHRVYQQLCEQADRLGKPPQLVAQEWLIERLSGLASEHRNERAKVRAALRAAGLLGELTPALRQRANPTVSLEEVEEALARAGGPSLSEIILEQRGPGE